MTIIWCMVPEIWSAMDIHFCHFALFFALLSPNNSENLNFGKMKETPGDITILQMCIINGNHMRYGSWDIEHNKHNFFFIFGRVLLFYPTNNRKIKILKKWKKPWRYHHFTQGCQKSWSYATLFLRYDSWWI